MTKKEVTTRILMLLLPLNGESNSGLRKFIIRTSYQLLHQLFSSNKKFEPIPISGPVENCDTRFARTLFLIEQIKKLTLEFISEEIKQGKVLSLYVKSFIRLTQCALCEAEIEMDNNMQKIANFWETMNNNLSLNGLLDSNNAMNLKIAQRDLRAFISNQVHKLYVLYCLDGVASDGYGFEN